MEPLRDNRISELRDERHLSLRDLAQLAKMDVNKVHRLETGANKLDVESMRRIAGAMGLKASALLLDEDVELRADPTSIEILSELQAITAEERRTVLRMAHELVRIVRGTAAASALSGEPGQVVQLAEAWNAFTPEAKTRALTVIQAVRP